MDDYIAGIGVVVGIVLVIVITTLTIGWVVRDNTNRNLRTRERIMERCLASDHETPCVPGAITVRKD